MSFPRMRKSIRTGDLAKIRDFIFSLIIRCCSAQKQKETIKIDGLFFIMMRNYLLTDHETDVFSNTVRCYPHGISTLP